MILIFSPIISNRIKYTNKLVFEEILGSKVQFIYDLNEFKTSEGIKVYYGNKNESVSAIKIPASGFLEENKVRDFTPEIEKTNNEIKLFPINNDWADFDYDIFASVFYMVSRYEEYLPYKADKFNRFEAKQSFAFQHDFLTKPVVNIWANKLKNTIEEKFQFQFPKQAFNFLSTIDIDNAWAFKNKGILRTFGGFTKDIINKDFQQLKRRGRVLLNKEKDPYDTYDYLIQTQKKFGFKSIYFFLMADYGHNDKNIPVTNARFKRLIKRLGDYANIGIHPGFMQNQFPEKLPIEITRLREITKREINNSRQHFLVLNMPETYRRLIENEITDDYTMGFAEHIGFRSGACTPYHHYDLSLEIVTKLKVHPFAIMEGTLNQYMELSIDKALEKSKEIIDEIKDVNGTFICLWHNETLNNEGIWTGWRKVFESTIKWATAS